VAFHCDEIEVIGPLDDFPRGLADLDFGMALTIVFSGNLTRSVKNVASPRHWQRRLQV